SRRRPRALNLNAIVAAHGGLTARLRSSAVAVVLTIGAADPRAADNHGRRDGRHDYPSCSSHTPLLRYALTGLLRDVLFGIRDWKRRVAKLATVAGLSLRRLFHPAHVEMCSSLGEDVNFKRVGMSRQTARIVRGNRL